MKNQSVLGSKFFFNVLGLITFMISSHSMAQTYETKFFGEKKISHGYNNICIIPKKFNNAEFSEKDLNKENELCEITLSGEKYGVCPKIHSTNPALEFHDLTTLENPLTKDQFEKQNCSLVGVQKKREAKKIAKFKSSTSCSYTPSILAYYQLSRYFGNILNVPQAVIYTIPVSEHLKQIEQAQKNITDKKSVISLTWLALKKRLKPETADEKTKYLITADTQSSFGALVNNPQGEEYFSELAAHADGDQIKRAQVFKENTFFKLVQDRESIQNILSRFEKIKDKVQNFYLLKDISDMIILDTLLKQEDRYNNIAYELDYYKNSSEQITKIKKDEFKNSLQSSPLSVFSIKRVVLKDNDCGVASDSSLSRTNINEKMGFADTLAHMSPTTYKKLIALALDKNLENYFKTELLFTSKDFAEFQRVLIKTAKTMYTQCKNGSLKLDLDENILFGKSTQTQSCEP